MDVSLEYVKQCEKAVEIRDTHNGIGGGGWGAGDYYSSYIYPNIDNGNSNVIYDTVKVVDLEMAFDTGKIPGEHERYLNLDAIWLPRQDQLQEMVQTSGTSIGGGLEGMLGNFYDFLRPPSISVDFISGYCAQFTSMEQLWMAFVMKEKYGKTWDGNVWVKV